MNSNPLISVIIPTFNNKSFIIKCIDSVLSQTYKNIECVIVDDGSTDETRKILSSLVVEGKISYYHQENAGVCAARNHGVRVAKGDFFVFLDADDIILPNAIQEMAHCLIKANADICVGLEKNSTLESNFPYAENFIANLITKWWPVSSVMVKKNNTLWNENRKTWEVIEYFADLLIKDFKPVICPFEVTEIDHNYRDDRTTIRFDHYNTEETFNFFNLLKIKLIQNGKINHGILEAIDYQLLSNSYTCYSHSKKFPKDLTENSIQENKIYTYSWYKKFGLSGFCYFFGIKKGIKIFYLINHLLKRA